MSSRASSLAGGDAVADSNSQWQQLQQRISARRLTVQSDPGCGLSASQSLRSLQGRGDAPATTVSRAELQRAVADAVEAAEARLLAALQCQLTSQACSTGSADAGKAVGPARSDEALAAAIARAEAAERGAEALREEIARLTAATADADRRLQRLEAAATGNEGSAGVAAAKDMAESAAAAAAAAATGLSNLEARVDGCVEQIESLARHHTRLAADVDAAANGVEAGRAVLMARVDSLDVRAGEQMDSFELRLQALETRDLTPQKEPSDAAIQRFSSSDAPADADAGAGTRMGGGAAHEVGGVPQTPTVPSPGPAVERFGQQLGALISRLGPPVDGVSGVPCTARPASALGSPPVAQRLPFGSGAEEMEAEVGGASIAAVAQRVATLEEAVVKLQSMAGSRNSSDSGADATAIQAEASFEATPLRQASPSPSPAAAGRLKATGTPGRSPSARTSSAGGVMGSGLAALRQELQILSRRVDGLQREQQAQQQAPAAAATARGPRRSSCGGGAGSLSATKAVPSPAAERLGQRLQALSDETEVRLGALASDVAAVRAACEAGAAASDDAASKAQRASDASESLKKELESVEARVTALESTQQTYGADAGAAAAAATPAPAPRPSPLAAVAAGSPSCGASTGGGAIPCRPLFSPAARPGSGSRPARSSMDGLESPSFALHRVGALPYPSAGPALSGAANARGEVVTGPAAPRREFHNGLFADETTTAADSGCTQARSARSASAAASAAASTPGHGVRRVGRLTVQPAEAGDDEAESRAPAPVVPIIDAAAAAAAVRALQFSTLKPPSAAAAAAAASPGVSGCGPDAAEADPLSPAALQLRRTPQQRCRGEPSELDVAKEELARAAEDSPGRVRRQVLAVETVVAALSDCGSPAGATDGRLGGEKAASPPVSPRRGRVGGGPRSPLRVSGGLQSPGPRVPSPLLGLIKLEGSEAWSDDLITGPGPESGCGGVPSNACPTNSGGRGARSLFSDEAPAPQGLLSPVLRLRGGARSQSVGDSYEGTEEEDEENGASIASGTLPVAAVVVLGPGGSHAVEEAARGASIGSKVPSAPQPLLLKPGARAYVPLCATASCGAGSGVQLEEIDLIGKEQQEQEVAAGGRAESAQSGGQGGVLTQRLRRVSSGNAAAWWQSPGAAVSTTPGSTTPSSGSCGVVYAPLRRAGSPPQAAIAVATNSSGRKPRTSI